MHCKVNNKSCVHVCHKNSVLFSFQFTIHYQIVNNFIDRSSYIISGPTCMYLGTHEVTHISNPILKFLTSSNKMSPMYTNLETKKGALSPCLETWGRGGWGGGPGPCGPSCCYANINSNLIIVLL